MDSIPQRKWDDGNDDAVEKHILYAVLVVKDKCLYTDLSLTVNTDQHTANRMKILEERNSRNAGRFPRSGITRSSTASRFVHRSMASQSLFTRPRWTEWKDT